MKEVNIDMFKQIKLEECLNQKVNFELEKIIKSTVKSIIRNAKKYHKFDNLETDKKIQHVLTHFFILITTSEKLNEQFENKITQPELYISIKRNYYSATSNFPV